MNTKQIICKWAKDAWTRHRPVVLASLFGLLCGLLLARETPQLRGYLLESVLEWRSAALRKNTGALHFAAENPTEKNPSSVFEVSSPLSMITTTPPDIPAIVFEVTQELSSSSSFSSALSVPSAEESPASSSSSSSEQSASMPSPIMPAIIVDEEEPAPVPASSSSSATSSASSSSSSPAPQFIPRSPESNVGNSSSSFYSFYSSSPYSSSPFSSRSSVSSVSPAPRLPAGQAGSSAAERTSEVGFPPFLNALYPVSKVPSWGSMHSAAAWNRPYKELTADDFVPVPSYDMRKLRVPFDSLLTPRNEPEITRKLFYSTHYFGDYDLDGAEHTAAHAGIDLKLALGTPLGAIGGGRVQTVENAGPLGLHMIIEHHVGNEVYYSVYGHLGFAAVKKGDDVAPGQFIGTVGITGSTSGPHLHLQIDRGQPGEKDHEPYAPGSTPSPSEADRWTVHPMKFIEKY